MNVSINVSIYFSIYHHSIYLFMCVCVHHGIICLYLPRIYAYMYATIILLQYTSTPQPNSQRFSQSSVTVPQTATPSLSTGIPSHSSHSSHSLPSSTLSSRFHFHFHPSCVMFLRKLYKADTASTIVIGASLVPEPYVHRSVGLNSGALYSILSF